MTSETGKISLVIGHCSGSSNQLRESIMATEMEKVGNTGDISLLFFLAGANFWAILAILGHFRGIMGNFG